MVTQFDRELVMTDRTMEFFSWDELAKQIGHPYPLWPSAILKELIDNGLDAAEDAGQPPRIEVIIEDDRIAVSDNGGGIPLDELARSIDFATRTTIKAHYVAPTRDRQGKALKTILAAPFVVSGDQERVTIDAHGVRHDILIRADRLSGRPGVKQMESPSAVKTGSVIALDWGRR